MKKAGGAFLVELQQQGIQFVFREFHLDIKNAQLRRRGKEIRLTKMNLAVLSYLLHHPGQLVTKDQLFDDVWGAARTDAALTFQIEKIRSALGDKVEAPRFIETVTGRGYRFICAVSTKTALNGELQQEADQELSPDGAPESLLPSSPPTLPEARQSPLVGRKKELRFLQRVFQKSLQGERQVVFIAGESGIGKTAVVDAFLASLAGHEHLWLGRGQCIEHYGEGEAYLPIFETLQHLSRQAGGQTFVNFLSRYAPTWLVQMPALVSDVELEQLQKRILGTTRQRMLGEMAEAFEEIGGKDAPDDAPVMILVLEDLHWSDYSTLDLIATLAHRREFARLLIIGTFRPGDVIARKHPLKKMKLELQQRGQCEELLLDGLTVQAVEEYLKKRFGKHRFPDEFEQLLHEGTEGHPFFLGTLLEEWVAKGLIQKTHAGWEVEPDLTELSQTMPESIRNMIEQQIDRLTQQEGRVMEAASVAGATFSAAAVAAGLNTDIEQVEEWCTDLVRRHLFLRPIQDEVVWPDGTVAAGYEFLHALYQKAWYERVTAKRRQQLHLRIGEWEEIAYQDQSQEHAAQLAIHFERGRDYQRTVLYRKQAGQNAIQKNAYQEAADHVTRGLALLMTISNTPAAAQHELDLQILLGRTLTATKGYAAPDVEKAYLRARDLSQQTGETSQIFPVLWGLCTLYTLRAELQTAKETAEQLVRLATNLQDSSLRILAHLALGGNLLWLGELSAARHHLAQGAALYEPEQHHFLANQYGYDPGLACLSYLSLALWLLGYPDQALKKAHEALSLAQRQAHPYSLVHTLAWLAALHQYRGEESETMEKAESVMAQAGKLHFSHWSALGAIFRGWSLIQRGEVDDGISQLHEGIDSRLATGSTLGKPQFLAMLAEGYGRADKPEKGRELLPQAFDSLEANMDRRHEAELYRVQGELILRSVSHSDESQREEEAIHSFQQAFDIARKQEAKSLELRAALSLARLWQKQGKQEEAQELLNTIYNWFTEGHDTPDLKEAKRLLQELTHHA